MSTFPSPNQDVPEVHGCRWKWCRCTFSTYPDLVQHVLSDHVRTFVPIRRQDISMLRRAEEGVGESLSLPDFLLSQSDVAETHNTFQNTRAREKSREVAPLSSLPSPPISSPTSLSAVIYDDEPLHPESFARHSLQRSHSPRNSNSQRLIVSPSNIDETHLEFPHQRHSPPTFASLSSPIRSQTDEMMIDPPTPTFDSLVAQAINVNKEPSQSRFTNLSPSWSVHDSPASSQDLSTSSNSFSGSSESLDSSRSQEFVEQELTQSMDIEEETNEHKHSSPGGSHNQGQPTLSIIPGVMNERTTPMPVRQAWYGTLPPRRSSLTTPLAFVPKSEMRISTKLHTSYSTPSQLSKTAVNAIPEHVLRFEMLQSSSAVNGRESASSQPQPYSQGQSQSTSQASLLECASYPLQTQAPYQSQGYSP